MEDVFRNLGYENVRQAAKTADEGRDIVMEEVVNGTRRAIVVECKHTSTVGRPVVQKLYSTISTFAFDGPKRGMVVTTGQFTGPATEYAERLQNNGDPFPFDDIQTQPEYAPNAVVADYDLGYFPSGVTRAYLRIRWFETDDFSIHYSEQYRTGNEWECRWDCHPNDHNIREHFHQPPDASTPGEDADYSDDWRHVLTTVLTDLDGRISTFWDG